MNREALWQLPAALARLLRAGRGGERRPFVRYSLGLLVAVPVALGPFLGKEKVPGFAALLELFPFQLRGVLIPLSTFLMGLIAVGVQYGAAGKIAAGGNPWLFRAGMAAVCLGLAFFTALYLEFVRLPSFGSAGSVAVIVADSRNPGCGCPPAIGDEACIQRLSLATEAIESCWDGRSLRQRQLALALTYLFLTGGLASLIGLLVLRLRQSRRRAPRRPRRSPRPPATTALH